MTTKAKTAKKKDPGTAPEPSFFVAQLVKCKALKASPDVIRAVLHEGKRYTMAEAKEAIKNYLTGKV